ncbi:MAG: hypothetical protein ACRD3S_14765 [Terracidiphilus sp.]
MTHLAYMLFNDFPPGMGLWIFLSIGAISLFGIFIPAVHYLDTRRKEREAFYKAETLRRITESSADGAKAAMEMMREEARGKLIKMHEGLKVGGLINIGVGVGLIIFLRVLLGPGGVNSGGAGSAYLCGLIPGFIGVAMLVYVYMLAAPIE